MEIVRSRLLSAFPQVTCGLSTRNGGVSPAPFGLNVSLNVGDEPANVRKNRELFLRALAVDPARVAVPGQIHSATVRRVTAAGTYPDTDALITDVPGVVLSITVADCVPLFLLDPHRSVVAAVHAGWRGTASGITAAATAMLGDEYGTRPADIVAYIGPAASSCCYVVGDDVAAMFNDSFLRRNGGATFLDLKLANRQQLLDCGVQAGQIEVSPRCTISEPEVFHSHRRDRDRSGRMMGVIGIVE